MLKEGSTIVSFLYPLANLEAVRALSARKATAFAMELIPRISRAQPMDALSSQANLGGYKAALLAAEALPILPHDDDGRRDHLPRQGLRGGGRGRGPAGHSHGHGGSAPCSRPTTSGRS